MNTLIKNPYWNELQTWPKEEWSWDSKWRPALLSIPYEELSRNIPRNVIRGRWDLCQEYAWSIPDPLSLEFVAMHLGSHAIEIGAGTGYYASMLAQYGTHVVCYDCDPPHRSAQNNWCSPRLPADKYSMYGKLAGSLRPVYQEVYYGSYGKAAKFTYPLFLCWPPMSDMAYKALKCYAGKKLVYIGESGSGCTADDAFFELLDRKWEITDQHDCVQWSGIHDWISVYERK